MQPLSPSTARKSHRGVVPSALFVTMLMAASVNALTSGTGAASAAPRVARTAQAAAAFVWTPAQVAELIEEIVASRAVGLDPQDYGLAALRGQLVLTSELHGAPGSRQLDILADTAALSLVRDYRAHRGPAVNTAPVQPNPADRAALHGALRSGMLRSWLQAQRQHLPQSSRVHLAEGV